jgi:hypothetical protein
MQKKYQVFISSTYTDLTNERNELIKAILDLGHIPAGMELFGAADEEQFDYIKKVIDECDYYVLIIAGRYGSTDASGVSYTEKEFDYALSTGKTVLGFIHNDTNKLKVSQVDTDPEKFRRLESFRTKVKTGRLVSFWEEVKELKANAIIALTKAFSQKPGIGWIRGDTAANEDVLARANYLAEQIEILKSENEKLKSQVSPVIEDIADLNDKFKIMFDYDLYDGSDGRGERELSWRTIFSIVGPKFTAPAGPGNINEALKSWFSREGGIRNLHLFLLFDSSRNIILMQLQGYGFLAPVDAEASEGTVGKFVLTDKGRRTLLENLVARKTG